MGGYSSLELYGRSPESIRGAAKRSDSARIYAENRSSKRKDAAFNANEKMEGEGKRVAHGSCENSSQLASRNRRRFMRELFELLAALSAGLFTGAALYINLVEHPARMSCGTNVAVTEFRPSYRRATVMQASLAAFGTLNAIVSWFLGGGLSWLIGGILLGSVIPFTLIVIFPTNRQLLDPNLDNNSGLALRLLTRWGRLHAIRSILSLAAFLIFLFSLMRPVK